MKYKTHNDKEIDTNWTSLIDVICVNYSKIVEKFGESNCGDGYKEDANWDIEFEDGKVATIYNYKDGINYNGENGMPTEEITEWHIGEKEEVVADRVKEILGVK
jgi:hypothetical protein